MNSTKKSTKNLHKNPSISFFNKYLINSIDNTKDSDSNIIINKTYNNSPKNPLDKMRYFNKQKKDISIKKIDTTSLRKRNKNEKEGKNIINKTINYDDSEGLLMDTKLSSSPITNRNIHNSVIYHPKKILRPKNEIENFSNSNNTKEKVSYISDSDIFDAFPFGKSNQKMDEKISSVTRIQSIWRRYQSQKIFKNMKLSYFINSLNQLINKCKYKIIKKAFNQIKNITKTKKIIYFKKPLTKKRTTYYKQKIKHSKSFKEYNSQKEENQTTKTTNGSKSSKKLINNYDRKFHNNSWIELPFKIENYIKIKIKIKYYYLFLLKFKALYKEKLKEKRNKMLLKLIHINNMKIIKKYMNRFKEKILIEKTKQSIFSLMKIQPKLKTRKITNNINNFFNFNYCYKQSILKDTIKKYGNSTLLKKYYFLWKKRLEEEKNNNNNENNRVIDNKDNNNKKKKMIKVKIIKKKTEENNNFNNFNDFNFCGQDTINNISDISNNNSISNSNISNSFQSINNIKEYLTTNNKKMKIKKVTVDHNYYQYIGKNNNFIDFK